MKRNYDHIKDTMMKRVDEGLLKEFILGISVSGTEEYRIEYGHFENDIFRMASMTKPITAVCALIAEEKGLLRIEDEVSKYIEGFKRMKVGRMEDGKAVFDHYASSDMTIKDILRHESGLGSGDVGTYMHEHRRNPSNLEEAVEEYKDWYLDFDPGTKAAYGALNALDIVGRIIEIQSGMDYFQFLKENLLDPLEMKDTTYSLNFEQLSRLAVMYDKKEDGTIVVKSFEKPCGFENFEVGFPGCAAGIFSTYADYMNFAVCLSMNGVFKGKRILSEDSVYRMRSDIIELPFEGVDDIFNWGYSVSVRGRKHPYQPLKRGTFGWSGAYSTHFFVNCEDKTAALFMTNISNDGGSGSPNAAVFEKAYSEILE